MISDLNGSLWSRQLYLRSPSPFVDSVDSVRSPRIDIYAIDLGK